MSDDPNILKVWKLYGVKIEDTVTVCAVTAKNKEWALKIGKEKLMEMAEKGIEVEIVYGEYRAEWARDIPNAADNAEGKFFFLTDPGLKTDVFKDE
jgi:hypothetical protein